MSDPDYEAYLQRWHELEAHRAGPRMRLEPDRFAELNGEFERLFARIDPADIQLDEWKRAEELRFLLILPEDDGEDD